MISNLDIKSKLIIPRKGRGKNIQKIAQKDLKKFLPKSSIKDILQTLSLLLLDKSSISSRFYRDLLLLNVIDEDRNLTKFGDGIIFRDESEWKLILQKKCMTLPKMQRLKEIIDSNPKINAKELIKMNKPHFCEGNKESSKVIYATKSLTWLK